MTITFYATVVVYTLLQTTALLLLKGPWGRLAWISVGIMATALLLTAFGWARGANLSPIYVVIALPPLILTLLIVLMAFFVFSSQRS